MKNYDAATSYALSFKNYLSTADQERLKEAFTKGLEMGSERSQALYDCLKLIREMPEGVWFAKTIDKALADYDNGK